MNPRTPATTDLPGIGVARLGVALGAGPAGWVVHLIGSVALVPYACDTDRTWTLHALTAATLLVAGAGLVASFGLRRAARGEADDHGDRGRFLGTLGLALGALFTFLIALEGALPLAVEPCR